MSIVLVNKWKEMQLNGNYKKQDMEEDRPNIELDSLAFITVFIAHI